MTLSTRMRDEIDRRVDGLREEYGGFPVHEYVEPEVEAWSA